LKYVVNISYYKITNLDYKLNKIWAIAFTTSNTLRTQTLAQATFLPLSNFSKAKAKKTNILIKTSEQTHKLIAALNTPL
jgi:hypothetical protein